MRGKWNHVLTRNFSRQIIKSAECRPSFTTLKNRFKFHQLLISDSSFDSFSATRLNRQFAVVGAELRMFIEIPLLSKLKKTCLLNLRSIFKGSYNINKGNI